MPRVLYIPALALLLGCNPPFPAETAAEAPAAEPVTEAEVPLPPATEVSVVEGADPVSHAILARDPVTAFAMVKHVLVSWDALAGAYARQPEGQDPRGAARTRDEAAALILSIRGQLEAGTPVEALMSQYSEDPGTNESGRPYEVTAISRLVQPFIDLALRLEVGEVGVVETDFGFHAVVRQALDPAVSSEVMDRSPVTEVATVRHILISCEENRDTYQLRGGQDARGEGRSRLEARAEVARTLSRLASGEDFAQLMSELSEDPGSASTGLTYDVNPTAGLVPPFRHLSLRLEVGEVGVVETEFGFHIIERTR